ncbi:MAG: hypothetical protein AAB556_01135 [Patescibacteria group bacterium]
MTTITIPKKLAQQGDLVVLPKKEYESLVEFKAIKEFTPTNAQKKALIRAEENLKKGKTMSFHDLSRKLGLGN